MTSDERNACRFVLIRHGQTAWNRKRMMQGRTDVPLNETGLRQARALAEELRPYRFDACYCSPLSRATQTTSTVLGDRKISIVINELLAEQSYGSCEGQWQPLVFRLPFCRMHNYQHHPERYAPPAGGESMKDMVERGGRALNEVLRPAAETHRLVLVGAHGSMICAMLNWIERIPLKDYWGNLLQNCGYAVIECADGAWRVLEKH